MTRLPPNAVATSTIPGGSVFTSPISAARSQPGDRAQRAQRRLRRLGSDEGDQLALVRDVHRVDPEDLGGARHRRLDRHVGLAHDHRHAGRPRQLVEHRGHTAAGGVAHAAQLLARGVQQRVDRRPQRARVRLHRRVELELPAREHDRRPVVADRPRDEDAVARAQVRRRQLRPRIDRADPGRAQVHLVGVAALDDLGVARDDLDARGGGRRGDRLDLRAQHVGVEPLLEHHGEADGLGAGARDSEVVDRAVDGQLADRTAGEADRLDDEAVGRQRDLHAADRHGAGVGQRGERGRAEGGDEQALDQRLRGLAARSVGHRDVGVLEARALGARGLDDAEDALLAVGHRARH